MENCLRDSKKLALWHTRTFRPLLTHDDLDSVLATRGFVGLPLSSSATAENSNLRWKEYVHSAAGTKSVTAAVAVIPRLPHPRIDGLHICTYKAFIDAVNFHLDMDDISALFHVRGMPLHRIYDRNTKWVPMEEGERSTYVYRDGTLDQLTARFYSSSQQLHIDGHMNDHDYDDESLWIRNRGKKTSGTCNMVSLNDVIVP